MASGRNYNKTLLLITAIAIAISSFSLARAQAVKPQSAPVAAPKIYVSNLSIDRTSALEGDTVNGEFKLSNGGNTPSSDVYYKIMLVGGFKDREARRVFDYTQKGPVDVDEGESRNIHFSYVLPRGVAGEDLAVRVQAVLKSGVRMGWADTHISIEGQPSPVNILGAALIIGDKMYAADSGPTLTYGQKVLYAMTVKNESPNQIVLTPHFSVYRYGAGDQKVKDVDADAVVLGPNETKDVRLDLPDAGSQAGVYFGDVSFTNKADGIKSEILSFRYILDGDIVTIQGVSANDTNVAPGSNVRVSVTYTGAPVDISSGNRREIGGVTLLVTALDRSGQEIGRAIQEVLASSPVQTAVVVVPIKLAADEVRYEVTAEKDGKTLSTYSSNFVTAAALPIDFNSLVYDPVSVYILIGGLGLTALILWLAVITIKIRRKHNMPSHITGMGMVISLFAVLSGLYVFGSPALKAFFFQSSSSPAFMPLFINLPYDNQIMATGQLFYLEGTAMFYECDNSDYEEHTLSVTYNGNTQEFVTGAADPSTASSSPYSTFFLKTDRFSLGPFTAPSTPGNYRLNATYTVPSSYLGGYYNEAYETVYVDTVISTEAATTTLAQSPTAAPCGGYTALYWGAVPQASEYSLYRDSSLIYSGTNLSYLDQSQANTIHQYFVIATIEGVDQPASEPLSLASSAYCPLEIQSIGATPWSAVVNQEVTWSTLTYGGSNDNTYEWTGTDGLNDTGRVVHKIYDSTGPKTATVKVTSSDGQVAYATGTLTVYSSTGFDYIWCNGSPSTVVAGHPVTWTIITDPASDYAFEWRGSDGLHSTAKTFETVYNTIGLKHAEVDVVGVGADPDCVGTVNVIWKSSSSEF